MFQQKEYVYIPCIDAPVISRVFCFSIGNLFWWDLLLFNTTPRRYWSKQIGAHNIEKAVCNSPLLLHETSKYSTNMTGEHKIEITIWKINRHFPFNSIFFWHWIIHYRRLQRYAIQGWRRVSFHTDLDGPIVSKILPLHQKLQLNRKSLNFSFKYSPI